MKAPLYANRLQTEQRSHRIIKEQQSSSDRYLSDIDVLALQWLLASNRASQSGVTARLVGLVIVLSATAGARGAVVYAGGGWAAIDRGSVCEALSRSEKIAPKGKVQAVARFSFTPDHKRWGEFHAQLSRVSRPGSSVILHVGSQPFLLVARADWAWSSGPVQEQAIIAAARGGGEMRVEARDQAGGRFVDPYVLEGAPTAIDAAAARCALRGAGKIQ
jgi:hypothetical protein